MTTSSKAQSHATVVVLGASANATRYSYKAVKMLKEYGYRPIPVHPAGRAVNGITTIRSLEEIKEEVDTLTVYVNSSISDSLFSAIIGLHPRRVIFNPGAENENLAQKLAESSILVVQACTLVLLRTDQF